MPLYQFYAFFLWHFCSKVNQIAVKSSHEYPVCFSIEIIVESGTEGAIIELVMVCMICRTNGLAKQVYLETQLN